MPTRWKHPCWRCFQRRRADSRGPSSESPPRPLPGVGRSLIGGGRRVGAAAPTADARSIARMEWSSRIGLQALTVVRCRKRRWGRWLSAAGTGEYRHDQQVERDAAASLNSTSKSLRWGRNGCCSRCSSRYARKEARFHSGFRLDDGSPARRRRVPQTFQRQIARVLAEIIGDRKILTRSDDL